MFSLKGRVIDLKKARRHHYCCICPKPILTEEYYFSIVFGGSGLASLKYPERVHKHCFQTYLDRHINVQGEELWHQKRNEVADTEKLEECIW